MRFVSFVKPSINVTLVPGDGIVMHWLREDVKWMGDDGKIYSQPLKGFLSDGYSVPQCMWGLVRGIPSMLPAYVHDHAYQVGTPKGRADNDLYFGVLDVGGPWWTACKVWIGLKIGGWVAYNRYKRMREQGIDLVALHTAHPMEEVQSILSEDLP